MKTLLIYETIHNGNTEKIGKVMADYLNADLIKASNFKPETINTYDLIGFGSGVYGEKMHKNIFDLIDKLPNMSNKKVFVFSTSSLGIKLYNNPVKRKLTDKGFDVVGSFACKGYTNFGPFKKIGGLMKGRPNDKDLQKAKIFADKLKL